MDQNCDKCKKEFHGYQLEIITIDIKISDINFIWRKYLFCKPCMREMDFNNKATKNILKELGGCI